VANEIEIVIKSKDMTSGFDKTTTSAGKLKSALGEVGKMAGGFLAADVLGAGAEKLLGFMSDGIGLATDLGEAISKVDQVFGESGAEIEDWASTAAESLGMSKREAATAAGDFGNLFDMMGVGDQAAADMSKALVQAAVDLGSFNNADATDVIDSMTSAFRGEYDSIQQFLPSINAASVEQKALAMTGKESADQLSEQDKMMAIVTMSTQELGKATGDFARTAEGAANAQKIANAELENAQTALGEQLIPLQMKFIELQSELARVLTEEVIPRLVEFKTWLKENEDTVRAVAYVLGGLLAGALAVCLLLFVAIATPIVLLIGLYRELQPIISEVADRLSAFFDMVAHKIAENIGTITGFRDKAISLFASLGGTIEGWKNGAISALSQFIGFIQGLPGRIAAAASGMWTSISNGFRAMVNMIIGWWNRLSFSVPKINIPSVDVPGLGKVGGGSIGGQTFRPPQIGYLASGGTRSGLALVGERGPELLDMGAGGHVIGANRTAAMLARGGGAAPIIININVEGTVRSDRDLVKMIGREIDRGAIPGLSRSIA
jgi:hypothetical protein